MSAAAAATLLGALFLIVGGAALAVWALVVLGADELDAFENFVKEVRNGTAGR